jgi:hypothetical protein
MANKWMIQTGNMRIYLHNEDVQMSTRILPCTPVRNNDYCSSTWLVHKFSCNCIREIIWTCSRKWTSQSFTVGFVRLSRHHSIFVLTAEYLIYAFISKYSELLTMWTCEDLNTRSQLTIVFIVVWRKLGTLVRASLSCPSGTLIWASSQVLSFKPATFFWVGYYFLGQVVSVQELNLTPVCRMPQQMSNI